MHECQYAFVCVCVCMCVVSVFDFSRSVNVSQRVEGGWVSIFFLFTCDFFLELLFSSYS